MRPHAGQESGAAALFTATRCEETLFTRPAGEWCPFTAPVHSGTPFSCEDTPAGEWCRCKRRRPGSGWRRRRDLGESRRISAKLGGSRRSSGQARPDLGDTSAISRLHLGSISANLPHPRRRAAPATFSSSLAPTRGRRDCAEIAPRLPPRLPDVLASQLPLAVSRSTAWTRRCAAQKPSAGSMPFARDISFLL